MQGEITVQSHIAITPRPINRLKSTNYVPRNWDEKYLPDNCVLWRIWNLANRPAAPKSRRLLMFVGRSPAQKNKYT